MRPRTGIVLVLAMTIAASAAPAQQAETSSRDDTRDQVRHVLEEAGKRSDVSVSFRQSAKEPYNFVGSMTGDLPNVDSLEVVVRVPSTDTIGLRVYPHYKKGYINLGKAKNATGLMRKLLNYNDTNFLFWGADAEGDLFAGYSFTLESGFPEEALVVVLRSIRGIDPFVGELRPFIDGSPAAPTP